MNSGGVHIIDDFISEYDMDLIDELMSKAKIGDTGQVSDDGIHYETGEKYDSRTGLLIAIQPTKRVIVENEANLRKTIDSYVLLTQQEIKKYCGGEPLLEKNFGITVYVEGESLIAHYDGINRELKTPNGNPTRDVSTVLYLGGEFTGGLLVFTKLGITINPKKGSLVIFPSGEKYEHLVTKVESGQRFMISQFWCVQ